MTRRGHRVSVPSLRAFELSNTVMRVVGRGAVLLTAIAGAAIVVLRRPDAVLHAQFWAEDGPLWFGQAWNGGSLHALTTSYSGYLQTLPRLLALPAVALGLRHAPLLFNASAIAIQVAPAVFFVSNRCESLVPRRSVRVLVAFLYLLLPNGEINANITNAQWHLALLAFLVIVARRPRSRWARALDCIVVAVSCLSGPFCLVLVPVAAAWWWRRRGNGMLWLGSAATAATAIQVAALLLSTRPSPPHLGASIGGAMVIFANRVVLAGSFAQDQAPFLLADSGRSNALWAIPVTIVGIGVLGTTLLRGPLSLRLFVLAAGVVMLGGMLDARQDPGQPPLWRGMATPPFGGRYIFMMEVAWMVSVIWVASRLPRPRIRILGVTAACTCFVSGVAIHWSYAPYADLHPERYASQLERAGRGTIVTVPLNPPGWTVTLVAH